LFNVSKKLFELRKKKCFFPSFLYAFIVSNHKAIDCKIISLYTCLMCVYNIVLVFSPSIYFGPSPRLYSTSCVTKDEQKHCSCSCKNLFSWNHDVTLPRK
jgi:hypothetical protein